MLVKVDLQAQVPGLEGNEICSFSYELELDALSLIYASGQICLLDPSNGLVEEVCETQCFVP